MQSRAWRTFLCVSVLLNASVLIPPAVADPLFELTIVDQRGDFGHVAHVSLASDAPCTFALMVAGGQYDAVWALYPGRSVAARGLQTEIAHHGSAGVIASASVLDFGVDTQLIPQPSTGSTPNGFWADLVLPEGEYTLLSGLQGRPPVLSSPRTTVTVTCDAPVIVEAQTKAVFEHVHSSEFQGGTEIRIGRTWALHGGTVTAALANRTYEKPVAPDHELVMSYSPYSIGERTDSFKWGFDDGRKYTERAPGERSAWFYSHAQAGESLTASYRGFTDDGDVRLWWLEIPTGWNVTASP